MRRLIIHQSLQILMPDQGKGKGGGEDGDCDNDSSRQTAADIANKRGKDNQWRGQQTREGESIEELGVGHPSADFNGVMLEERDNRVRAAKGEESAF